MYKGFSVKGSQKIKLNFEALYALKSNKERTAVTEMLVNYGMMHFTNTIAISKDYAVEKIKVSDGNLKEINLVSPETIILTIPKSYDVIQ